MTRPNKTSPGLHILIWYLYYVPNWERLCWIFLILVVGMGLGYLWNTAQQSDRKYEYIQFGREAMVREIAHEIPKGNVFHIDNVKFIPRIDKKAVNVKVAGAGDEGMRKTWEGK